jgi:hypothetical protein
MAGAARGQQRGRREQVSDDRTTVPPHSWTPARPRRLMGQHRLQPPNRSETTLTTSREYRERHDVEALAAANVEGINTQFCDALATIGLHAYQTSFEIAFAWSKLLDPPRHTIQETEFSPQDIENVTELGQELQQLQASTLFYNRVAADEGPSKAISGQEIRVRGFVVALYSPGAGAGGIAVVAEEDSDRVYQLVLEPTQYQLALQAHAREALTVCVGVLEGEGRQLWLRPVQDFAMVETERPT